MLITWFHFDPGCKRSYRRRICDFPLQWPVHSGHPWNQYCWPLQTGGGFKQVVLYGISATGSSRQHGDV